MVPGSPGRAGQILSVLTSTTVHFSNTTKSEGSNISILVKLKHTQNGRIFLVTPCRNFSRIEARTSHDDGRTMASKLFPASRSTSDGTFSWHFKVIPHHCFPDYATKFPNGWFHSLWTALASTNPHVHIALGEFPLVTGHRP